MNTSCRWTTLIPVLILLTLSPATGQATGQASGLLGQQNLALGASFSEYRYSTLDVIQWAPPVYDYVDRSYTDVALFGQVNLPASSGLDFSLGLSMQSVNSQTLWSPGIAVVGYLPDRDLKPFVALSGGVIGTMDSFTSDHIGYFGLTGGVEFPLGKTTFSTLSAHIVQIDGEKQWGLGLELGHWFDPKVCGNLGFQYADVGPDTNWTRNPHSLGMSLAFAILIGDGKDAEPRPEREPLPTDVCPR